MGLAALATVITTQATIHRETQTLLAVASLERDLIAFNLIVFRPALSAPDAGPTEAESRLMMGLAKRTLDGSVEELAATADRSESELIDAGVQAYFADVARAATLIARTHAILPAAAAIERTYGSDGSYASLTGELRQISTSSDHELALARTVGLISEIFAFALMLLAFSLALSRARRSSREKHELLEKSRIEANTDSLTGLPNRRKLFADAEALQVDPPSPGEFAIGMFDLDGFKDYNDTFGHPAGDALLARLGAKLMAAIDGFGTAYRMGGDEFCVVALGDHPEDALAAAAEALSEHGEHFSVTCSRGFVAVTSPTMTFEQALQQADQRLYADKGDARPAELGITRLPAVVHDTGRAPLPDLVRR